MSHPLVLLCGDPPLLFTLLFLSLPIPSTVLLLYDECSGGYPPVGLTVFESLSAHSLSLDYYPHIHTHANYPKPHIHAHN